MSGGAAGAREPEAAVRSVEHGEPTVSVVIPTFNRAGRLERAIKSAQAQSGPIYEIIVVDDSSTDGTPERIEGMAASDGRIRVLRHSLRQGAPAARNTGIEAASGRYVAFLDSDDAWAPAKTVSQLDALRTRPDAIACFTGNTRKIVGSEDRIDSPPTDLRLADLYYDNVLGTSSAMVRRDALIRVGMFDLAMQSCQDWDLFIRILEYGEIVILPEPLTICDAGDHPRISRNAEGVLSGHREMARRILAKQTDATATAELRRHHAFKEADLVAVVGQNYPAAALLAARAFLARPDRVGCISFARLLLRPALGLLRRSRTKRSSIIGSAR